MPRRVLVLTHAPALQGAAPAEAMINSLVQCQLSYINTIDPNFVGGTSAIALVRSFLRLLCGCSGADFRCVFRLRRRSAARGHR